MRACNTYFVIPYIPFVVDAMNDFLKPLLELLIQM